MNVAAIIVCAGKGRRFGSVNKAFARLAGKPLFYHAVRVFFGIAGIKQIVVVLQRGHISAARRTIPAWEQRHYRLCFAAGGEERIDSVRNGLACLDKKIDHVLIHDGARPLVSQTLIKRVLSALHKDKAVICGLSSRDTLKKISAGGYVRLTLDRSDIVSVQTPQGFQKDVLLSAYQKTDRHSAFDDAQLVEATGVKVKVIEGEVRNFKITYPQDLRLAQGLVK